MDCGGTKTLGRRPRPVSFYEEFEHVEERPPDPVQEQAEIALTEFFSVNSERVCFGRQIELHFEDRFFHWVTSRALRSLIEQGFLAGEEFPLKFGGRIKLIWKKSYRFYRRSAKSVVDIVGEYSLPAISEGLGDQGEVMVLEALTRNGFSLLARETAEYRGKKWEDSEHDLDLVTLPYIRQVDFEKKREVCAALGLKPLFAVRMMPKTWIYDLQAAGGYSLILKTQFYPWGQKELAQRVAMELGLPVVCSRAIEQGLIEKFIAWHKVNLKRKSHRS